MCHVAFCNSSLSMLINEVWSQFQTGFYTCTHLLPFCTWYDNKVLMKRIIESSKLSQVEISFLLTTISYLSTILLSMVTTFEISGWHIILLHNGKYIFLSCFLQMVLVAIFSETGFFDYCAVKVSWLYYNIDGSLH